MSDAPRTALRPSPGTTLEEARDARACVWAFVFQCWQEKEKGGPTTAPDARKEIDESGTPSIPK
jgi:hypothetical protein